MAKPAYDRALGLLARRPHFRRELERKLRQRGYEEEEVEAALERLEANRLLDDHAAAQGFVRQRLARGDLGRRRLRAELEARGAASSAVEAALAELEDDDRPAARRAAERWLSRGRDDEAALARHLERRGFSPRAILAVLAETRAGRSQPEPE